MLRAEPTRAIAAFGVALVLLAAGCGGDDAGEDSVPVSVPLGTIGTTTTTVAVTSPVTTGVATTEPVSSDPATTPPTSEPPALPDPSTMEFVDVAVVDQAVDLAFRPGDDARYVVSKQGFVVALRNGEVDSSRSLDITGQVATGGEQGLLGLTFSPDGSLAYVNLTNTDGDTEIREYEVDAAGVFDTASERLLLTIPQPYENHNGGQVRIGPDGYLYIGMGDGGSGGDPERRASDPSELLGKLLRIDPNPVGDSPYSIPPDNPFVGVAGYRAEIWSLGLRNPWRFSFDRVTTDLWIADVGQGEWEEIDVAWADLGRGKGADFGWSAWEGTHPFNDDVEVADPVMPIHEYPHGDAGCSVSGGVRYRGALHPALAGWYVYGDYCSGQIRALQINDDRTAGQEFVLGEIGGVSAVTEDQDGELVILSVTSGRIVLLASPG